MDSLAISYVKFLPDSVYQKLLGSVHYDRFIQKNKTVDVSGHSVTYLLLRIINATWLLN